MEVLQSTHEIWARMVWAAVDLAERGGIPTEPLFEGLPFDHAGLRKMSRVRWDDYCALVERLASACGGDRELEDLLESNYHLVLPELRTLAGAVISPIHYLRLMFDVLDPLMFPPLHSRFTISAISGRGSRPRVARACVGAARSSSARPVRCAE